MSGCRRPHRKSRLGCKVCKSKRIKCDEIHPLCGQCKKYGTKCDFDMPLSNSKSLVAVPPMKIPISKKYEALLLPRSNASGSIETLSTAFCFSRSLQENEILENWNAKPGILWAMAMDTPQDRLLEFRLMHHYTTTISATLIQLFGNHSWQESLKQDAFSGWLTRLALNTPGLMSALLSFSAFNLRKLQGNSDRKLTLASHGYLTAAIAAQSEQLDQGINAQNAEILFAGACLLAFISISSHEFLSPDDDSSLPLHWFQPWQGVRSIVKTIWQKGHIRSQEILTLLESERHAIRAVASPFKNPTRFDFLLEGLDKTTTDPEVVEAYETSVQWLSLLEANPDRDYGFKFTAQVPAKLVELLRDNDPRTLTIVGYFFMVSYATESLWWLPRTTSKEFRILMEKLPEEWRPRMAMAMNVFEACDEPKFQPPTHAVQSEVAYPWHG